MRIIFKRAISSKSQKPYSCVVVENHGIYQTFFDAKLVDILLDLSPSAKADLPCPCEKVIVDIKN